MEYPFIYAPNINFSIFGISNKTANISSISCNTQFVDILWDMLICGKIRS